MLILRTDEWIDQYNQERPHEGLNNLTPVEYLTENSPEVSTFSWHKLGEGYIVGS